MTVKIYTVLCFDTRHLFATQVDGTKVGLRNGHNVNKPLIPTFETVNLDLENSYDAPLVLGDRCLQDATGVDSHLQNGNFDF